MTRTAFILAALLAASTGHAAEPVRIGISTVLSGQFPDRGQSEQYGAQLAVDQINQAGGVLGRPIELFYRDNACKPPMGIAGVKDLIEQQHVPVIIGALCTPVTHAIMPVMADAKVPLVIATSAGQDFVDASGVGGNDYAFKTIPSDLDIARGLVKWMVARNIKAIAMVADADGFQQANAESMVKAAREGGLTITANEKLAATGVSTTGVDFPTLLKSLQDGKPDMLVLNLGPSNAAFFRAFEAGTWRVPLAGRVDLAGAAAAVTPQFRDAGGLADLTSVAVFSTALDRPDVQAFVAAYRAHTGLTPTQRSFFVHEAVYLVVDAIRRAGTDTPAAIHKALKATTMPSRLGGSYVPDDHNHAHTPLFIIGLRDGKPTVIATE
jgi:branched-chain amino acid transport system substrate-binding protein